MTKLQELLDILLTEIVQEEKTQLRKKLTNKLCSFSLKGVNPNEINENKTCLNSSDNKRYYFNVSMKNGSNMTVPIEKRYISDVRMTKLERSGLYS